MDAKERKDWHKLANMLGYVVGEDDNSLYSPTTGVAMLLCGDDALPEHTREAQAMLIGLALEETNGEIRHTTSHPSRSWTWRCESEAGLEHSRPAAAIAMLEAYRSQK